MPHALNSPRVRLLVVDADVGRATALARSAQAIGCKTAVAFGPGMAQRVAELFGPDLVLLDLALDAPEEDAARLLAELRRTADLGRRALYAGMAVDPVQLRHAMAAPAGLDRLLHKPVPARALHELVTEARERALERELRLPQPGSPRDEPARDHA